VLRLVADENFKGMIVRALRRASPAVDAVRVQDVGLRRADDQTILAWAAGEGRVLLTHDAKTMIGFAYERVRAGLPMPGLIEVDRRVSIGQAVEDLLLIAGASLDDEMEGQVRYLPL
jgi:hypothetical protein